MATYPYRFECDLILEGAQPKNTPDPTVRVYVGETYTNDETGEKTVNRQQPRAVYVKLSNLEEFLAASVDGLPPEWVPSRDPMAQPPINMERKGKK